MNDNKAKKIESNIEASVTSTNRGGVITPNTFKASVAIWKSDHHVSIPIENSSKVALTLKILNFDSASYLNEAFKIEGVEYSDNGKFNDKVAGDGIYTSVETFEASEYENSQDEKEIVYVSLGKEFKYMEELKENLRDYENEITGGPGGPTIELSAKVHCDIVTRPCPQDHWYNTCWFSDECTCVYLENCDLDVNITIKA